MMTLEVQHSKNKTLNLKYTKYIRKMMGVCLCSIQASDPKDDENECIKGDVWFGFALTCAALGENKAFLKIKGNRGLYPNDFIEEAIAGTSCGTRNVLKGKHPNGVPLVAFVYRYI
jgi:hypothetical protein